MLLTEGADKHELHLCANNREVKSFSLSNYIPNLNKKLVNNAGACYYYVGYLAGDYLDEAVNTERSDFVFYDMTDHYSMIPRKQILLSLQSHLSVLI